MESQDILQHIVVHFARDIVVGHNTTLIYGPDNHAVVLDAPPHVVAEVVDGELWLSPRPAGPHTSVASALGEELMPPFRRGRGGRPSRASAQIAVHGAAAASLDEMR